MDLTRVVEVLRRADAADGLEHLRPLLAPDVVLSSCDVVVVGAAAVVATVDRWIGRVDTGIDVLDVVDGGDRMAVRYEVDGRQGALFLRAGDDGRVVSAAVAASATGRP